jgi:hypothetical protein
VYLHGTQNLATIYADSNNTPLSNPFTANAYTSPNSGGWIFWAATSVCYDVVGNGGVPFTYASPITLTEVCLGGTGGSGATSCSDLPPLFNCSVTGNNMAFVQVNASPNTYFGLDGSSPAFPTMIAQTFCAADGQHAEVYVATTGWTCVPLSSVRSCEIVWGGSGSAFALQSGDDAITDQSCLNELKSGVTETITGVFCRSDSGSNTTTINPTFGTAGTGSTICSGPLTCGSGGAYSASCTISNGALAFGNNINPVMGGTLTGTSIHVLVVYTVPLI